MLKTTYRENPRLKRSGVHISYTKKQIDEFIKCSRNVKYFINNYVSIVTLPSELSDGGIQPFKLWPFQERLIDTIHDNRFTIIKLPRQVGKCVISATPIKIRNKNTGEIKKISIGQFYQDRKENE